MTTVSELLDLRHTLAEKLFEPVRYPWEALKNLRDYILSVGPGLSEDLYEKRGDDIWIARGAHVFDSAYLKGPCIIGPGTEIRQCAFLRGSVLAGEGCVIGNSTELKNALLFDGVQVPHFNYVGDSVLGYKAHMGAGAVTSNVKSDKTPVTVKSLSGEIPTGMRKLGAIVGDFAEIGCHAVFNPGTVVGRNTIVYPLTCVRGEVPAQSILKNTGTIVPRRTGQEN